MWKIVDIRDTPSPLASSYAVAGGWEHAEGAECIAIYNGTGHSFSLRHAPCQLTGATRIAKGASGTYEHASLPWVKRLERALEALQSPASGMPAIAVMDAPPPEHVYEALSALESNKSAIEALKGTNTLLLLCGRGDLQLPVFGEGTMTYSGEPWQRMRTYFSMFLETPLLTNTSKSLEVPLALLIGSYQASVGPSVVQLDYPAGTIVPVDLVPFIEYSGNVRSPRVSTTRGILVNATDSKQVWAKVVVQDDELTEEDPVLTLLRQSFSKDVAQQGAAYFQLREVPQTSPLYNIATAAIQRIDQDMAVPRLAPLPLARLASYNNNGKKWH